MLVLVIITFYHKISGGFIGYRRIFIFICLIKVGLTCIHCCRFTLLNDIRHLLTHFFHIGISY